jgi:hypothetical protein
VLTFTVGNKPPWISFNSNTGRLSGTPGASDVGTFDNVLVHVSDGKDTVSLGAFSIIVTAATTPAPPPSPQSNSPPTISGIPPSSVLQGQAYAFTPTATDADGDTLTFTINNAPPWVTFDSTTGRLSGTPAASHVGVYNNVTIRVSDSAATASLTPFGITVVATAPPPPPSLPQPPNTPPAISGNPGTTVTENQAYSFTPSASDANGDTLTFTITNRPSWATFNSTTGRLSGTPTASHVGVYNNITIRVSDSTATASLTPFDITVAIAPPPPPPPSPPRRRSPGVRARLSRRIKRTPSHHRPATQTGTH